MPSAKVETVIVVKKKGSHDEHHGGAWKVAYADFVTALLALFIVLWLLNSDQKVQKAVGGYFQDPTGAGKLMGNTKSGAGEGLDLRKDDLTDLKKKIEAAMEREIRNFEKLKSHVLITITEEGLRVELTESDKGVFFESGSPSPTQSGSDILSMLGRQLGQLPNKVVIEGHTDSNPFHKGEDYSNWELSTERANTARRLMHRHGLRQDQVIQVRGFADQRPKNPEDPADSSNRRVSVIVRFLETKAESQAASLGHGSSVISTPGEHH